MSDRILTFVDSFFLRTGGVKANAQSFVSDIVSEISTNASSVIDALKPSLDGIYQTISGLTSQIISEINTALESGSEIFNSIVNSVSAQVSDIVELVTSNATDVANALKSSFDSFYVDVNDFAVTLQLESMNGWMKVHKQA